MRTTFEHLGSPVLTGAENVNYMWDIPGWLTSTDLSDDPPWGLWPKPELAYADLLKYLRKGTMPALPSSAQIQIWVDLAPPQVTHVVRIG